MPAATASSLTEEMVIARLGLTHDQAASYLEILNARTFAEWPPELAWYAQAIFSPAPGDLDIIHQMHVACVRGENVAAIGQVYLDRGSIVVVLDTRGEVP